MAGPAAKLKTRSWDCGVVEGGGGAWVWVAVHLMDMGLKVVRVVVRVKGGLVVLVRLLGLWRKRVWGEVAIDIDMVMVVMVIKQKQNRERERERNRACAEFGILFFNGYYGGGVVVFGLVWEQRSESEVGLIYTES